MKARDKVDWKSGRVEDDEGWVIKKEEKGKRKRGKKVKEKEKRKGSGECKKRMIIMDEQQPRKRS